MRGHIQGSAFADLRLGGRGKNEIDFKVLRSMERLRGEMKRTMGFFSGNRGMVVVRELTTQVRRKNRMDCTAMPVISCSMAMVGFRMDMHQWCGKHP